MKLPILYNINKYKIKIKIKNQYQKNNIKENLS